MGRAQDFADNLNDDDFSLDNGDQSATAVLDAPAQPSAAPAAEPQAQAPAAPAVADPLENPGNLSMGPWAGQGAPAAAAAQAPAQADAQPAAAPEASAAPQVPAGFAGYLASQGMTGFAEMQDGEAMEAFLGYIRNQEQQIEQQRQQAAWYQHQALLAQQAQLQMPVQQAAPVQPATQPAPAQSTWQKPPEWNPAWNALLTRDDQGNLVAVPGAQPDLPQKYRAYQEYLASMQTKMFEDPANFLLKEAGLGDHVRQMAQQVAQEQFAALQQQAAQQAQLQQMQALSQQITQQHSHWMYQRDPYGQPMRNPQTGEFLLTPDGAWQRNKMVELLQSGIPQHMAFQLAYDLNVGRVAQEAALEKYQAANGQPAAPATPQQAQQAANDAFLRARRQPNRNGTQPVAVNGNQPAQNEFDGLPREQRIGLMLKQAATQAGFRLDE